MRLSHIALVRALRFDDPNLTSSSGPVGTTDPAGEIGLIRRADQSARIPADVVRARGRRFRRQLRTPTLAGSWTPTTRPSRYTGAPGRRPGAERAACVSTAPGYEAVAIPQFRPLLTPPLQRIVADRLDEQEGSHQSVNTSRAGSPSSLRCRIAQRASIQPTKSKNYHKS